MTQIFIPPRETKRWTGVYPGKFYGVLWKTRGIDLDRNDGVVSLSRRFERIEDSTEIAGNATYAAFLRTNADCTDRYWGLRLNEGLVKTDSATPENSVLPSADWDTDAIASSPTDPRDFTVHGNDSRNDSGRNKLFVSRDTGDIAVLNDTGNNAWTASWWVTKHSQPPLSPNVVTRPIEYFPFRKITIVGSGNLIHTISRPSDTQNDTVTYARLTLPKNLNARHIMHTPSRAWILTDHRYGGQAQIVEWDGFSETYNDIHRAFGVAAMAGVDYNGVPIILNDRGQFLEFNGRSFEPMKRNGQTIALPMNADQGSSLISGADSAVVASVLPRGMTVGEDGLIYINVAEATISSERFDAGVWCLDPVSGRLYNKNSIGRFGDSVDYGHADLSAPGGLYAIPGSVTARSLLAGGIINTTASAGAQTGIWLLEADTSTSPSKGYIITQYMTAEEAKDTWDSLWLRFKRFMTSGSQMIVKARGTRSLYLANRRPLSGTITWTSATTFTVTLAASDDALAVGDEVEVLNGVNAGWLAHITTISGSHAALQTITIDESVTTASSTSTARFDRWEKAGIISNNSKYEDNVNLGINSSFLQLKIELRGLANEMELMDMILNTVENVKTKK